MVISVGYIRVEGGGGGKFEKRIKWSNGCLLCVRLCHGIVQHTSGIIKLDMFQPNSPQKWSIGRFLYVLMGRDLVQPSSGNIVDKFLFNPKSAWVVI